ncbi:MAG: hypothetical protein ACOC32_00800 [Nanoarchaeota archaeon]
MRKKAMGSQVDWAISIAIFLLFTLWFFIVLRQYVPTERIMESDIARIEEAFKEDVAFEFSRIPIFVSSPIAKDNVPVFVKNPVNWSSFVLDDYLYSVEDEDNMFFMADVEEGMNVFFMKHSEREYQNASLGDGDFLYNLSDTIVVDSQQYSVRYPDNILEEIFFRSQQHLYDFNMTMNGEYLVIENASRSIPTVFAKHDNTMDWSRLRSYVFPDNSYVFAIMDIFSFVGNNVTFGFEFTIPMADTYFLEGYAPYSVSFSSGCLDLQSSVIDFEGENTSTTFMFDREMDMELCDASTVNEDLILFTAEFDYSPTDISKRLEFIIFSHEDTYVRTKDQVILPSNMSSGIKESYSGISRSKLTELSSRDVEDLVDSWNFSEELEFSIEVYDADETYLVVETADPGVTDVFSRTFSYYLIDPFGNRKPVLVNIKTW